MNTLFTLKELKDLILDGVTEDMISLIDNDMIKFRNGHTND